MKRFYIVLTGPTASGKTALALALADAIKGGIINGDSMQLYSHLSILTARPSIEEHQKYAHIPYALDGILSGQEKASAGFWVKQAEKEIQAFWDEGRIPIIVGGTGLYLKALTEGLSPIPEIPEAIRVWSRHLIHTFSLEELKKMAIGEGMEEVDQYKDPQRLMRSYEVFKATGFEVSHFYVTKTQTIDSYYVIISIIPDREKLYEKINARFSHMMENGAISEVKNLMALKLDQDHPILKATGVKAIAEYLEGSLTLAEATELGQRHTRQYAKRQCTWIKGQVKSDLTLDPYEEPLEVKLEKIRRLVQDMHKKF